MTTIETIRKPTSRVWFITGSSIGFGRVLAEAVLAHGDQLVATARRPEQLQELGSRYPDLLLTLTHNMAAKQNRRITSPKNLFAK